MTTLLEGSIPGLPHDDKSHMLNSNRSLTCPYPEPDKSCPQLRTIFVSDTLTFPLSGDVTIKYKTFCNLTKKSDGQTYVQPLDYDLALDLKTGSSYFSNMFNENKLLGEKHVLQFSNTTVNCVYSKLCLQ
jgi:hypothetical protein